MPFTTALLRDGLSGGCTILIGDATHVSPFTVNGASTWVNKWQSPADAPRGHALALKETLQVMRKTWVESNKTFKP